MTDQHGDARPGEPVAPAAAGSTADAGSTAPGHDTPGRVVRPESSGEPTPGRVRPGGPVTEGPDTDVPGDEEPTVARRLTPVDRPGIGSDEPTMLLTPPPAPPGTPSAERSDVGEATVFLTPGALPARAPATGADGDEPGAGEPDAGEATVRLSVGRSATDPPPATPSAATPSAVVTPTGTAADGTTAGPLDRPGTDRSGTDQPGYEQFGIDRPGSEQAGIDRPGSEQVGTGRPGTEHVGSDRPGTGHVATEHVSTGSESADRADTGALDASAAVPATAVSGPATQAASAVSAVSAAPTAGASPAADRPASSDPGGPGAFGTEPGTASGTEPGTADSPGTADAPGTVAPGGAVPVPLQETDHDGPRPAPAVKPQVAPWQRLSSAGALIWLLIALFGFTLVVQLRSNDTDQGLAATRQEDLVAILSDLEARETRLNSEIAGLEESQRQLTSGVEGNKAALAEAERRANELGLLAGTLPGRGPGLEISITAGSEPIKASAILNTVQELRGSGGEVMQLAGSEGTAVRVIASSAFVDADGGVLVDGTRLTSPYLLTVIGAPQTMDTALRIPGGVVASVGKDGGTVNPLQRKVVEVTAVRPAKNLQYARPVS